MKISPLPLLFFSVGVPAADYTENVHFGILKSGQPLVASARPPGRILEEHDSIVEAGGMTWAHQGPGTWTAAVPDAFAGVHKGYFMGEYSEEGGTEAPKPKAYDLNTDGNLYAIRIYRGGVDITNRNSNVAIGERIDLECQSLPVGTAIASVKWAIPASNFKNFVYTENSATVIPLAPADLIATPIQFYWNDTGTKDASVDAVVAGFPASAKTTFTVKKPASTFTATTQRVVITNHPTPDFLAERIKTWLEFGDLILGNGIVFNHTFTPDSDTQGSTVLWQIVNVNRVSTTAKDVSIFYPPADIQTSTSRRSGMGYDTSLPMPQDYDAPAVPLMTAGPRNPAEAGEIQTISSTVDDHFNTYLMFKSDKPNSLFVPLRRIDWFWSGTAKQDAASNFGFSLSGESSSSNPTSVETTDLPTWNQNAQDIPYKTEPSAP